MADKEVKSTTRKIVTNDQVNYYLGITSITVNGKNAYDLKGKFLEDLHKNAFSGTNGEDAVKHIEYFLKIVNPTDLPNVNQDKLRVVVFPISLVGDAWRWFDGIKGSIPKISEIFRIETNMFDYETPQREEFKEFNYILKIDHDLLTKDIEGFKAYEEFKDDWIYEWNNDWSTCGWREDGYCNRGNLPEAYIIGNSLHYQDYEWYEALEDRELKEKALRNKVIIERTINDDDESIDERQEICSNETHELPVCNIRRFEMIKYSFRDDEEYVAVKEDEYDDLTNTSKDACRAYQEIFRIMDEGWMVTRDE
ncbi:hypothetical protein Tco_1402237 [Tanacetum coccineum]